MFSCWPVSLCIYVPDLLVIYLGSGPVRPGNHRKLFELPVRNCKCEGVAYFLLSPAFSSSASYWFYYCTVSKLWTSLFSSMCAVSCSSHITAIYFRSSLALLIQIPLWQQTFPKTFSLLASGSWWLIFTYRSPQCLPDLDTSWFSAPVQLHTILLQFCRVLS